ncbi:MAG TPA: hypothetical protein VE619_05270 [Nitrososphaeraceae archaeon]|nr:hypothetical protein [Nitrososphaeraceae archaeon]
MVYDPDPLSRNIVTPEEVNSCLHHIDESKKEQFLKVIEETEIALDEPAYDDSIDGASIRAMYIITVTRKGRKEPLKFQYISETSIDFNKTPVDYDESDAITESYDILERDTPTLHRILGLLKRNYFLPQDFSYKMAIEHINKLRQMFSKEEILAFPSIDISAINIGLTPI